MKWNETKKHTKQHRVVRRTTEQSQKKLFVFVFSCYSVFWMVAHRITITTIRAREEYSCRVLVSELAVVISSVYEREYVCVGVSL